MEAAAPAESILHPYTKDIKPMGAPFDGLCQAVDPVEYLSIR